METDILKANAATEAANDRSKAMHLCTSCEEWFESTKLYDDTCKNCK